LPKPDNRKSEDKPEIRNKDADEQLIIQAQEVNLSKKTFRYYTDPGSCPFVCRLMPFGKTAAKQET